MLLTATRLILAHVLLALGDTHAALVQFDALCDKNDDDDTLSTAAAVGSGGVRLAIAHGYGKHCVYFSLFFSKYHCV